MMKNIVIIYGSGASYDSGYGVKIKNKLFDPPMDCNFFESDATKEKLDNGSWNEYYALKFFRGQYYQHSKSLESFWSELDLNHKHISLNSYNWHDETGQYIKRIVNNQQELEKYHKTYLKHVSGGMVRYGYNFSNDFRADKLTGDCGTDLRRLIYDIYANFELKDKEDDRYMLIHKFITQDMAKKVNLLGYITFNYDCFLEKSLLRLASELDNGEAVYRYLSDNENIEQSFFNYKDKIILKLHGSLNWEENSSIDRIKFGDTPFDPLNHIECSYEQDSYRQAGIIPPTAMKEEVNSDTRGNNKLTSTILNQWRNAITLLRSADNIIFIGYSLPNSDFHVKRLLRLGWRLRFDKARKFTVLSVLGNDENERVRFCKVAKDIYCDDELITEIGFKNIMSNRNKLEEFLSR